MKTTERNDTSNVHTHKKNTYTNRISTTSSGSRNDDREGQNYDRYELIYNNNGNNNNSHHNYDNQRYNIIGHEQHSVYSDSETTLTTTSAVAALSHLTSRQKYDRFRPIHPSTSVIEEEAASTGSNDPPYYNNTTTASTRITINQPSPRAAVPMDISIVSPDEQQYLPQQQQQRATPVANSTVTISAVTRTQNNGNSAGHRQPQSTTPAASMNAAKQQQQLQQSNRVTPPSQPAASSSTMAPRSSGSTNNNRPQQSQRPPTGQPASPQLQSQQPLQQQQQQQPTLALPTYSTYDPILPNPTPPTHPSKNQRTSADVADPSMPAHTSLLHSLSVSASSSSAYDWMARVRDLRQSMQTTRSLSLSQSNMTIPHNYDPSQHPSQPAKSSTVHYSSSGHSYDPRRHLTPSNTPLYQLHSPYTSIDGRLRPSQPTRNPQNYDPYARVLTHSSIRESVDRPNPNLNTPPDQLTRGLRSWTEDIRLLGSFSYCSDPRSPQSLRPTPTTTVDTAPSAAPTSQAGIERRGVYNNTNTNNIGTTPYTPSPPSSSIGHSHTLPVPELLLVSQEGDVVVVTMLRDKKGQDRLCRLCIHYKRPHQLCIGRVTELMKTEIQYIIDTRHIHTPQTSSSPQKQQQKSSENQHDKLVAETQFISPIGRHRGPSSSDVSFSPGSGGGEGQNYDLSLRRSLTFDRDLISPSQPHPTSQTHITKSTNTTHNNNSNSNVHTPHSAAVATAVAEAASLVTQSTGVETHTTSGNSSGHHSNYTNHSNNSDNTQPYPLQTTLPKGNNSDRYTANTHEFKSTWSSHFHSLSAPSKVQGGNPLATYTILSSNLSLFNGYDPIPTTTTHTSTHTTTHTNTTATNSKENAWLKSYHILSLPTTLVPLYTRISKTIDVIKSRIPYIILYKFPTSTSTSSVKPPPPSSSPPSATTVREKNEKITSSSSSTTLLYTLRNIPYKAMLMCNEPTADFCIQWLHGAKLRYCLRSGLVSLDYPSSFDGGTEGGRRGQNYDSLGCGSSGGSSNHWEGMLPTSPSSSSSSPPLYTNTTNDSSTNQQHPPPVPVPGFIAPYILIAQEAMSRCIKEHRVIQLESIKPKHIYHIDIDDKGREGKGERKGQNYDHPKYNIPYVFTEKS